jgi:glycosyltransferase involved in cell wall biosynthesis
VFFGAINVYLQEKLSLFRKTPRWLDRVLDSRALLNWAAKKAGSTQATGLEEMTLSMLRGEDGRQAKELDRLVEWLRKEGRPDVVHLASALLLGLARRIKTELDVPVFCTLQDEDTWIDAMREAYVTKAWDVLRERGKDVACFVAVSRYYAERMAQQLDVPRERMRVVHVGVDPDTYEESAMSFDPPVLGYLSKMTPSLGLGVAIDAFMELKADPAFANLRFRAMGGVVGDDMEYVTGLKRALEERGWADDAEFVEDMDQQSRLDFLKSLTVLSVPVPRGEAFGLYIIEANACGVPVVQPQAGGFPELIEQTGGGLVYTPNDASALAAKLKALLSNPDRARGLGRAGRRAVREYFNVDRKAQEMVALYEKMRP